MTFDHKSAHLKARWLINNKLLPRSLNDADSVITGIQAEQDT
jgi:hypothetical protein